MTEQLTPKNFKAGAKVAYNGKIYTCIVKNGAQVVSNGIVTFPISEGMMIGEIKQAVNPYSAVYQCRKGVIYDSGKLNSRSGMNGD